MNKYTSLSFEIDPEFYEQLEVEESCSDISDLTDIFEEFHRNSFLRANAHPSKKYLTKTEADWKTRDSFSDEFKKNIEETRKDLGVSDTMFDEGETIEDILTSKPTHNLSTAKKITVCDEPIKIEKESSRKNSEDSTTWKILSAHNESSSFNVSPPVYNCYGKGMNHWLERPNIPWRKVDESRLKCETWLDKI